MAAQKRYKEYMRELDIPEIIPEMGGMISEYTGGSCDSSTLGGERCWSHHEECDEYCLSNLSAWLKPIFMALVGKRLKSFNDSETILRNDPLTDTTDKLEF